MKKKVAVVIPSYTETLKCNEIVSLMQVKRILVNYDIFFLLPDSLKIDYCCDKILEKRYPDECFMSLRAYSKFMLKPDLYQGFNDYEYILIYQLDAFVFEDRLKEFCDLKYDYIGAPWLDGIFFQKNSKGNNWYVGNGGLSLRKVESFLKWTVRKEYNQYIDYINEDLLIAAYGAPMLDIAPMNVALSFSFEGDFDRCIELTKGCIPFGCHAWERYSFFSWKSVIEKQGYEVQTPDKRLLDTTDLTKEMNSFCSRLYSEDEMKSFLPITYCSSREDVYIWGTGLWGISLMFKLLESGINIAGFIDNDVERLGKRILSYEIFSWTKLNKEKKTVIVAIKKNSEQVEQQLQECGYKKEVNYTTMQYILEKIKWSHK